MGLHRPTTLKTNGVRNALQSLLNLIPGTGITLTPDPSGGVTIAASGGGGSGAVVQKKMATVNTVVTGHGSQGYADSIPSFVGTMLDVISLTVTPTDGANDLYYRAVVNYSTPQAEATVAALWRDGGTNDAAIRAIVGVDETGGDPQQVVIEGKIAAGTTDPTTFDVKIGGPSNRIYTVNGTGGARKMGGAMAVTLTVEEVVP